MSTNVPSLSTDVPGTLVKPILTTPGAESIVKLPVSSWPAIVTLVFRPVTWTLPAAVSKVAVRSLLKAMPGRFEATWPVKFPLAPVAVIARCAEAPLTVSRPPPSDSARWRRRAGRRCRS